MNISESVERLLSKIKDMLEIDYVKDTQELIMLESHIDFYFINYEKWLKRIHCFTRKNN